MSDTIKLEKVDITELQRIFDEIIDGAEKSHFNPTYIMVEDGHENLMRMLVASMKGETISVLKDENTSIDFFTRLAKVTFKDEFIGFLIVYKNKELTELIMASIFPEFRGKGFGKEICKLFKKIYKKNQLLVRCKEASTVMIRILTDIGFKIDNVDVRGNSYLYFNKKK